MATLSILASDNCVASNVNNKDLTLLGNTLVVLCAHNEAPTLGQLLRSLSGVNVLVINDGSTDDTLETALCNGVLVINHERRIGKPLSLREAIQYAMNNGFDVAVVCDADVVTDVSSIEKLVCKLAGPDIGAAVARQIPIGLRGLAFNIDELMWASFDHGRKMQLARNGTCHLGGVMFAVKVREVAPMGICVNDDEQLGIQLRAKGLRVVLAEESVAYFDASSSIGHILERRKRMLFGHMLYRKSAAPSMDFGLIGSSLVKSLLERPYRIIWLGLAISLESLARIAAWRDRRNPEKLKEYLCWVTKHAKNNITHLLGSVGC